MNLLANRIGGLRAVWQFDNRYQLVLNRLLFRRTGLTVYTMHGRDIIIDHRGGDEHGLRICITTDMYSKYLGSMQLGSGVTVLDLGANAGGFPLMLELEGIRIARLVCVEMNPNTATRLRFNIARNLDCNCRIINAAVCGERQEFELYLGRGSASDSLYQDSAAGNGSCKYTVPGITLDDLEREEFVDNHPIDVCKMDVEGAEYDILFSSTHSLLKRVRYLIMEIHRRPGYSKDLLVAKLEELGFAEVEVPGRYNDEDVHMFVNRAIKANDGCREHPSRSAIRIASSQGVQSRNDVGGLGR
jgi:FkbM family methyltransferase